jgi:hypothetical protein
MRKSFASRALGLLPLTLIFGSSCSLVYDLSPDQCGNSADCVRMFGQGFVCSEGLCECPVGASCEKGTGGTGGTAGDAASGGTGDTSGVGGSVGGDAGTMESGGVGGASAGRGTGGSMGGTTAGKGGDGAGGTTGGTTGGTSGDAGMGGMMDNCTSHAHCFELYPESVSDPRACVEGTCVPLRSPDCPVILPLNDNNKWDLLLSTDAIILGAFAPLNNGLPDTYTRIYDLAVTEFSDQVHGVFAGDSERHEMVMVVCNDLFDSATEVRAPAKHLVEELGVKGLLGTLLEEDQQTVWEEFAKPNDVFMMVPLYSDQSLIDEADGGRIWHMLSGAKQLSVSYQPLIDMTRTHLVNLGSLGASEDMKLALVTGADQTFLADTRDFIMGNVQYNGKSVALNGNESTCTLPNSDPVECFLPITVVSAYENASDDQVDAIDKILDYAPHIIVGANASEILTKIIPGVEASWDASTGGRDRPFYLLGAINFVDPAMPGLIDADESMTAGKVPLFKRILGVNWPSAEDMTLYDAFQLRYQGKFGNKTNCCENHYDAAYYLMYGLAAARQPLAGSKFATAMLKVIGGTTEVPIGPNSQMAAAVNGFKSEPSTYKIKLMGAQGPPNWDDNGARNDAASVWCVNPLGVYGADQLRYNKGTMLLDGTITCFTFPEP